MTLYDLSCFPILRRLIRTPIAMCEDAMIMKGMRKPTQKSYVTRNVEENTFSMKKGMQQLMDETHTIMQMILALSTVRLF